MTPEEFALLIKFQNGGDGGSGDGSESEWNLGSNPLLRDTGQSALIGGIGDLARGLTRNTFRSPAPGPWLEGASGGIGDWSGNEGPPPLPGGEVSPLVSPPGSQDLGFNTSPFPWESKKPTPGPEMVSTPLRETPRTRAILLPNGKILYTNVPSSAGSEIPMAEAGRLGRDQDRQNLAAEDARLSAPQTGPFSPIRMDPATESMKALVRSAARATEAADRAGTPVEGTVSQIEGTDFQKQQRQFEDATQAAALAGVQQERRIAELPLQESARLGNRDVVAGQWQLETIKPMLDKITEYTIGAVRSVSTPGNPNFIADEKARALEIQRLEDEMNKRRNDAIALGSVLGGQRIPGQQY